MAALQAFFDSLRLELRPMEGHIVSRMDTVHTTKDAICYYRRRKADKVFDEKEKRDNALRDDLQTA